jgi:hypothetical protein
VTPPIGRRRWAIAGGRVPPHGTGAEPAFTGRETLCLLNAGDEMANVRVTFLYVDRDPVGPYRVTVAPRRVRQVRVNDLIFPEAVPLDAAYACEVVSDAPVVVQCTRQDTRARELATLGTVAFPAGA